MDPERLRYIERRGFIIADLVAAALPEDARFTILDGGAREALADPRWQALDRQKVRLYGFEPDEAEVEKLNREVLEKGFDYRYFAGALWSECTDRTFYENKSPGGGSFFPQNTELTGRWKFQNNEDKFNASDIFYPVGEAQWRMTDLETWAAQQEEPVDFDFMKLNVQGAELEILHGAESLLDRTIGLMVEISFVESYKDRPFFSDIDAALRERGFTFFDLIGHHYIGRSGSAITVRHLPGLYPLWGQLIEGHGIYFRDPIDMDARGIPTDHLDKDKLLRLCAFAEVFGQIEYAFELLAWTSGRLEKTGQADDAKDVRDLLARAEDLYRQYMS